MRTPWALLPVVFAALLVLAVWLRYGGRTSDSDTATITQAARGVLSEEVITPGGGVAYTNGFAYPVLVATLANVTGLSLESVQTVVLPWLLVALALIAFVTFRTIAGSARAGAISALLLLVQPDFLFVTQRGSHEKVTWLLALMLVFCLVSSFRRAHRDSVSPYILVFYACGFAFICSNTFFGSSFIASIFLVLLGTALAGRLLLRDLPARRLPRRFAYPLITLGCFSFLFMFHIYPISQHGLKALDTTVQRVAALYLSSEPTDANTDRETTSGNESDPEAAAVTAEEDETVAPETSTRDRPTAVSPYATIAVSWTSLRVYFLLTAFTWLLIGWAVLVWFLTAARFIRRGVYRQELPLFIAWAFAAATALQIALSILGDTTGSLGSNVQLRLFPSFTLFAVPLVVTAPSIRHRVLNANTRRWLAPAGGLVGIAGLAIAVPAATIVVVPFAVTCLIVARSLRPTGTLRWLPNVTLIALFAGFTVAALMKATNDPLVSNKWTFYNASEARGLHWVEAHFPAETVVWSEFDERLATVARAYVDQAQVIPGQRRWAAGSTWETEAVRYAFVSDITAARASRLALPLPGSSQDDWIYDNGRVQVMHWVPETPYQP